MVGSRRRPRPNAASSPDSVPEHETVDARGCRKRSDRSQEHEAPRSTLRCVSEGLDKEQVVSPRGLVGELSATRMVLWEAVERLPDGQADELEHKSVALLRSMRARWDSDSSDFQAALLDELEFITHKLRYRHRLTERGDVGSDTGGVDLAFICGRCDTFPLRSGDTCPEWDTSRWFVGIRS